MPVPSAGVRNHPWYPTITLWFRLSLGTLGIRASIEFFDIVLQPAASKSSALRRIRFNLILKKTQETKMREHKSETFQFRQVFLAEKGSLSRSRRLPLVFTQFRLSRGRLENSI